MIRKLLCVLGILFAMAAPAAAQVTITFTFTNGTAADADQVNANFAILAAQALNRTGGTMTGTLLTRNMLPTSNDTYDLGSTSVRFRDLWLSRNVDVAGVLTLPNVGLNLKDIDGSHYLLIQPGSNLTANRTLTVTTGDATRAITLTGSPTLADWFDQSVKVAASPTFAAVTATTGSIISGQSSGVTTGTFEARGSEAALRLQTYSTSVGSEAYIAYFGPSGDKMGVLAFQYPDRNATSGFGSVNVHATAFTGGVSSDNYGWVYWAKHGMTVFPASLAAADAPGDQIFRVQGTVSVATAISLGTLTTSQAVFSNSNKELVSNAITGTGNVVMSASPTLSGTIGGALTFSGNLTFTSGLLTVGTDAVGNVITAGGSNNDMNLKSTGAGETNLWQGGSIGLKVKASQVVQMAHYGAGTATFDASGNITSVSDERLKDRIAPLPYGLAEVLQLNPIQYGYNAASGLDRTSLYGGFSAQNILPVMPLAIGHTADGYMSVSDRPILGALVNSVKTLAAEVDALKRQAAAWRACEQFNERARQHGAVISSPCTLVGSSK